MTEFPTTCKFCEAPIKMVGNKAEGWKPQNPDGSSHNCRGGQPQPIRIKPSTPNEHKEFENQKASFSPAMENEIRRIVKEEFKGFLQWMASQAEGQA